MFWSVSAQSVYAGDLTWSRIASGHGDHHARMLKICVCRGWIHVTCINMLINEKDFMDTQVATMVW